MRGSLLGFFNVTLVFLAVAAAPFTSFAQTGPSIPCVECPEIDFAPRPETGLWHNPLDPGIGFMFEIQDDILAGYHLVYDVMGQPVWFLIAGLLQAADEESEATWVVESELPRFAGGRCVNCPTSPAMFDGSEGVIRFEFFGRNFGRFKVDDGPWESLLPVKFGVRTEAVFPELTEYRLPDLEGAWIFHVPATGLDLSIPSRRLVLPVKIVSTECADEGRKCYEVKRDFNTVSLAQFSPPPHPFELGRIVCVGGPDHGPFCRMEIDNSFPDLIDAPFIISLANLSDSRFVGVQAEGRGLRAEAFRIDHD